MDDKNFPITKWAEEDRPREKMLKLGKKALSNSELLGIILGSGNTKMSAVELAKQILNSVDNNLIDLYRKSSADLVKEFNGIGDAKAVSIMAALELGSRMWSEINNNDKVIANSSKSLYNVLAPLMLDLNTEEFWAIFLNNNCVVLHKQRISQGGLTATMVDVRCILKIAIEHNATSIVIAHNHPSGNIKPSSYDHRITDQIKDACNIMNINLLDHIILGNYNCDDDSYFSFSDNGLI